MGEIRLKVVGDRIEVESSVTNRELLAATEFLLYFAARQFSNGIGLEKALDSIRDGSLSYRMFEDK